MLKNLITACIIDPKQFSVKKILEQVAKIFKIHINRIIEIRLRPYQGWVNIAGVGGKFFSYRLLPIWREKVLNLIKNSQDLNFLQYIGDILGTETRKYKKQYDTETLNIWRDAWLDRKQYLTKELEKLKPILALREKAQRWQESWLCILAGCQNLTVLKYMGLEIEARSEEFRDFPEIVDRVKNFWFARSKAAIELGAS